MENKKWKLKEQIGSDLEEQLLHSFDIEQKDKEKFLNPDYELGLRDPFDILNMDKAVDRILEAIEKDEKIIVFGDYDADGVCASAIFNDFFRKIDFENFEVYIPNRRTEGYGLSFEKIDQFEKDGVNLIITVDCGITDHEEIKRAKNKKIDVVVTDHHLDAIGPPSDAVAVVDPKQSADNYPFDMMCGAGVAFKVVEAILKKKNFNVVEGWTKWLLDLVCIATVADMVDLVDENRVFVKYGLKVMAVSQRPGLVALYKKLKLKPKNITEDDIAFLIAPRINTAGRMEHANISFNLLTTTNPEEATWGAGRLEEKNIERRQVAEVVLSGVEKKMENIPPNSEAGKKIPEFLFFGDESWNIGVLGVATNRVLEKYNKPVFLWGKGENKDIKGSSRSDGTVNLVEVMKIAAKKNKGLFLDYGGHKFAAGFTVEAEKIKDVEKAIQEAFKEVEKEEVEDELFIDKELELDNVNVDLWEVINKFSPFGVGNPKPNFLFKNLKVLNVRKFGNGGIHLGLDFKTNNGFVSAIGFFMNGKDFDVKTGEKIDLVANVEKSTFKGYDEIRLRIVDFKVL